MHAQLEWPDFRIPPINLWVMPGWNKKSPHDKSAGLLDLVAGQATERRRAAGRGRDADKSAGLTDLVAGQATERRRVAGRGRDAEAQAQTQKDSNSTHEMNQTRQLHRQLLAIRGGNHGNQN